MTWETKPSMLGRGAALMTRFCEANALPVPKINVVKREDWKFDPCAYYRPVYVAICVEKCAAIGYTGMQWSFPGHSVDRTPYGALAHELGHHADRTRSERTGLYYGDFSVAMRQRCAEAPLTSYCPNDAEWFAEMFRLFVTNPDLLAKLRPATHADLLTHFKPVFADSWRERLDGAPERTILSIDRKLTAKPTTAKRPTRNASQQQELPV